MATASPVIKVFPDRINEINESYVSFGGTGETAGNTIRWILDDTNGANAIVSGTAVVGSDLSWNVAGIDASGLDDDSITLSVNQDNGVSGISLDVIEVIEKNTIPIPAFSLSDFIYNPVADAVGLSVTGEIGNEINYEIFDKTGAFIGSGVGVSLDGGGAFSTSVSGLSSFSDGRLTATVVQINPSAVPSPRSGSQLSLYVGKNAVIGSVIQVVPSSDPLYDIWNELGEDVSGLLDGTLVLRVSQEDTAFNAGNNNIPGSGSRSAESSGLSFKGSVPSDPTGVSMTNAVAGSVTITGTASPTDSGVAVTGTIVDLQSTGSIPFSGNVASGGVINEIVSVSTLADGQLFLELYLSNIIGASATVKDTSAKNAIVGSVLQVVPGSDPQYDVWNELGEDLSSLSDGNLTLRAVQADSVSDIRSTSFASGISIKNTVVASKVSGTSIANQGVASGVPAFKGWSSGFQDISSFAIGNVNFIAWTENEFHEKIFAVAGIANKISLVSKTVNGVVVQKINGIEFNSVFSINGISV